MKPKALKIGFADFTDYDFRYLTVLFGPPTDYLEKLP